MDEQERKGRVASNRAVFLDRDNTLIVNDGDLGDPAGVVLVEGAREAVESLRGAGYRVVVVTNQGGVARGKYTELDVERVNARINELLDGAVERFYSCPYHPEATVERYRREHPWRKPNPGMLLAAAEELGLDLKQCWLIGDQARDVEAGKRAGVRTIQITREPITSVADFIAPSLPEAVRVIESHGV